MSKAAMKTVIVADRRVGEAVKAVVPPGWFGTWMLVRVARGGTGRYRPGGRGVNEQRGNDR